ncbi:MAG: type II CAAX endopeptidase family protein [Peptoniphilus sp.]|nr:type II CAAX endopeptidase family protein [Peptoniphilus sp.]MDD7363301.1 type II CAAX endopeptidase family protein [Bacillota bacterium]MDY6045396.1 type II CAAX endopeptidase family protein [Peptoniphilus sp.]
MTVKKVLGVSIGAVAILIVAQIISQWVAEGIDSQIHAAVLANGIGAVLYLDLSYLFLKYMVARCLRAEMSYVRVPRFSIQPKWIAVGVALPLAVMGVYLFCFSGTMVYSDMTLRERAATLSAGIAYTGIAAGFVEEMVFRGVILRVLEDRWNRAVAILLPSALFGALHTIGTGMSFFECVLVVFSGTLVGVMFSCIALESGSVFNSGLVHALWNIAMIGGGLSIGNAPDPYAIATYVLDSTSFAATGGAFGVESSLIACAGYGAVILLACYRMKKDRRRVKSF